MTQQSLFENVFKIVPPEKLALLTKEELIILLRGEQSIRLQLEAANSRLRALNEKLKTQTLLIGDELVTLKNKIFNRSSEKSPSVEAVIAHETAQKDKKKKVQLPSLRYPNALLIERHVELVELPDCNACGDKMRDSGMTEDSEYLTVIPAEFLVVREKKHKYCCESCHGDIKTAPSEPRIKQGSSYSDEMIVDVAASKYCDLVPVERYTTIAGRAGLQDLPANSLIESTHYLADFVEPVYAAIKAEVTSSRVVHADETPHRMLEGDRNRKNYYLWGFSSLKSSFFEIRGTRSGEVASSLLAVSKCEFLVSDVFSGYGKAVTDSNAERKKLNNDLPQIQNIYCNAHARRKFKEAELNFADEAKYFIDRYKMIYRLEAEIKETENIGLENRKKMEPYFLAMKARAVELLAECPSKSSLGKALSYFIKNYSGFTHFLKDVEIPIDNNAQERLLRNPVIGRKTWYGTHSKRGAKTAAIMFSIVESCKLNKVNPRQYLKTLIAAIHQGKPHFTPAQFASIA